MPAINKSIKLNVSKFGLAVCNTANNNDEITNAMYLLKESIRFLNMYPLNNTSSTRATIENRRKETMIPFRLNIISL